MLNLVFAVIFILALLFYGKYALYILGAWLLLYFLKLFFAND